MAFLYGDPFTILFKWNIPSCWSGCAHPGRERQHSAGKVLTDMDTLTIKNQNLLFYLP